MDKSFVPDVSWMAQKYDEMNAMLFNGKLGACEFGIFTTGRGSGGGVLGWFKMLGKNIMIDRRSRRMFVEDYYRKQFIDEENFVALCNPKIELNGNYRGTEHGFLCTLVHEMCHYYTYMNGWAPTQAHGREFRNIGMAVASRSNGLFTVQRLASAEQMSELELNDEMKSKKEKRLTNKKSSVSAVFVFHHNGRDVELTITSSAEVIEVIKNYYRQKDVSVVVNNNADVIDFLFSKGYNRNMRTWRYWDIGDKPWVDELKGILLNSGTASVGDETAREKTAPPKRIFSIKTTKGTFECEFETKEELVAAIKQRMPNMSDETIDRIINNPANYKETMNESNSKIKRIIKEVIEEYLSDESLENTDTEEVVSINPGMNLGLVSPLQM